MTERTSWSKQTRDRWFLGALLLSAAALAYLLSPFLYVLLFAAVAVVVTWPVYQRICRFTGGRRGLAAVLSTLLLLVVILGPMAAIVYLFVLEAVDVASSAVAFVQDGGIQRTLDQLDELRTTRIGGWVTQWLPAASDRDSAIASLQAAVLAGLNTLVGVTPLIAASTANALIDAAILLFAVPSLYLHGPRLVQGARNLSPLEDDYERRLIDVFAELSHAVVVGSLATAAVQGVVAAVGYAIAGVERVVFMGILTALFSFVPVIGTAAVWVPLAIYVGATTSVGWGLFVAVWSLAFTGTVDNVVKPFLLRGSSDIHPLLVFLAVLGGLAWFGLPGLLLGPVIVAAFLALYTLYARDFLGIPEDAAPA